MLNFVQTLAVLGNGISLWYNLAATQWFEFAKKASLKPCSTNLTNVTFNEFYTDANFQRTLLVEIRTLVAWLKSTLLLKVEFQETHFYMETECLQTNQNGDSQNFLH